MTTLWKKKNIINWNINLRLISLIVCILLSAENSTGQPRKKFIKCHGENLAAYVEVPDKRNSVFIMFIPAAGYMDGTGRSSPEGVGVFTHWQKEAVKLGFSTVQFDKPGAGSSSGRLNKREEEALLCTYKSLPDLSPAYNNKLILFTYGGGVEYIRYALGAMAAYRNRDSVFSVVQIAGMISTDFKMDSLLIPYLSLLGDTAMTTGPIKKALLHKKIGGDSLSRIFIMDNVNVSLCTEEKTECKFRPEIYDVVFNWIHKNARKHYIWLDKLDSENSEKDTTMAGESKGTGKIRPDKNKKGKKFKFGKIDRNKKPKEKAPPDSSDKNKKSE